MPGNDRLEFDIPYEFYVKQQVHAPDFIVRLHNSLSVVLEIKGKQHEDTDVMPRTHRRDQSPSLGASTPYRQTPH
jgi:hypothetical protein